MVSSRDPFEWLASWPPTIGDEKVTNWITWLPKIFFAMAIFRGSNMSYKLGARWMFHHLGPGFPWHVGRFFHLVNVIRDLFIPDRWRSRFQPFKRVTEFHHPKKVTSRIARYTNYFSSRWFKVPFSSPGWRSLNPLKGSRFTITKRSLWITRLVCLFQVKNQPFVFRSLGSLYDWSDGQLVVSVIKKLLGLDLDFPLWDLWPNTPTSIGMSRGPSLRWNCSLSNPRIFSSPRPRPRSIVMKILGSEKQRVEILDLEQKYQKK